MRNEQHGGVGFAEQLEQLRAYRFPQLGIEMTERLVEQQQCRSRGERADERDPLLLPSGNFMRISLFQPGDVGQSRSTLDPV